jgi:ABC-type Mn2+/Zn2+ transport system permease subunit
MGPGDVRLMAIVTALTVVVVIVFYKEFLVTSFDTGFARSAGFPAQLGTQSRGPSAGSS